MKGLVIKDFYLIRKYCRMCLLIAVVFAVCSALEENVFIMFYPVVLGGVIPVTLVSCDEKSKWSVYAETFPYTRKEIVSAKYLITLLYLAAVVLLSAVSQAVSMLRAAGEFRLTSYLSTVFSMLAVGLIVPGMMLPAIFKLGVDRGRIVYYGIIITACGLFGVLGVLTDLDMAGISAGMRQWFAPLLLAAGIVIFAGSWLLSVKFYQEREL